jgi:SAM-dependent methyltransferase
VSTISLLAPPSDPVRLFEVFNASFGSKMLVAAARHFRVFEVVGEGDWTFAELAARLNLADRPTHVLITTLLAMGLLSKRSDRYSLTTTAKDFLVPTSPFAVSDYLDLATDAPGVNRLVESMRTNRPKGAQEDGEGAQYVYKEGMNSAMSDVEKARRLTMALAGRAKTTAPILAERMPLEGGVLLDVAAGSGFFSIAYLQRYPRLRAKVLELPEVVPLVQEVAEAHGVADRLEIVAGDMFSDPLPSADAILLSNVLHDWDIPDCLKLLRRCGEALPKGGRVLIHDAFLNDALDGPLPIAIYSIVLFFLTFGRAYSLAEYREWLQACGFEPGDMRPTIVHCGVLPAVKRG